MRTSVFSVLLVSLCLSLLVTKSAASYVDVVSKMNDGNTTEISERVFKRLDTVENVLGKIWQWTKINRHIVKTAMGVVILFYGGKFTNTILLIQSLSLSSLETLGSAFKELGKSYKESRQALRKELPNMIKAEADMADLLLLSRDHEKKLKAIKVEFSNNKITATDYAKKSLAHEKSIADIRRTMQMTRTVQNSLSHLKESINPKHVQKIFTNIYQSLIIGMAAVHSQAIGTLTMGLHIGKVAFDRISKMYAKQLDDVIEEDETINIFTTNAAWIRSLLAFLTRAVGVILSFMMDETFQILSACSLGSDIVVDGLETLLDPLLSKFELPTIKGTPQGATIAQTALFVVGVKSQLLKGKSFEIPALLRIPLLPVLIFELFLKKLVLTHVLF